MNPYDAFFQSVRDTFTAPASLQSVLIILGTIAFIVIIFRVLFYIYNRYQNTQIILNPAFQLPKMPKIAARIFNTAQKKAVYDIIAEFKRSEIIAEAIPESVLERFSEFFYERLDRLNISPAMSKQLVSLMFPLISGQMIELEFIINNKLSVYERKVLQVNDRAIVVESIDDLKVFLEKGTPLHLSYLIKNQFLAGESRIENILNERLVLSYPKNLLVSNERRFSRVPLEKIQGNLHPLKTEEEGNILVEVKDISFEGARIRTSSVLKKKSVYSLSFADTSMQPPFGFQNFECVVSKHYLAQEGVNEYGLSFVYLDLDKRSRLTEYIRALIERIKNIK